MKNTQLYYITFYPSVFVEVELYIGNKEGAIDYLRERMKTNWRVLSELNLETTVFPNCAYKFQIKRYKHPSVIIEKCRKLTGPFAVIREGKDGDVIIAIGVSTENMRYGYDFLDLPYYAEKS